jgi:hypothetical protein
VALSQKSIEVLHRCGEVAPRSTQEKMIVVPHEAVSMALCGETLADVSKEREKELPGSAVIEDDPSGRYAIQDVIPRSWVLNPQRSGHADNVASTA